MAQSWNQQATKKTGQPSIEDDFIVKIQNDPSMPQHAPDQFIRECLANQRCVVVQEHLEGPESFSKEEIGADVGGLSRIVQWKGQYT
jgi:hypothetical protein